MTDQPKNLAVLRIAKITSLSGLGGASAHNTRTADAGLDHADDHAPRMGGGIQLLAGSEDAVTAWRTRCEQLCIDPAKVRKDGVRAIEIVMSASPEWFIAATPDERIFWRDRSLAWATELVGPGNVLQATIHDDEDTPHLHLLAIPAVKKARRPVGRPRKGRKPVRPAPVLAWGLSAADLIGSRTQLVAHQTAYAAELADIGIRRGVPRRVTGIRHQSAHVYRAEAAADREAAAEDRENAAWMSETMIRTTAEDSRLILAEVAAKATDRGVKIVDQAQVSAAEILSRAERQAGAFSLGLDAIDAGELVYRPAKEKRGQGLDKRPVDIAVLPTTQDDLRKWREAVAPFWERLLSYADRVAGLCRREDTLDGITGRQAFAERVQVIQNSRVPQEPHFMDKARSQSSQRTQDEH